MLSRSRKAMTWLLLGSLAVVAAVLFARNVSPPATEAAWPNNLMAFDADETDDPGIDMESGGGSYSPASIDTTKTVPVGVPFDVSIDILHSGQAEDDYEAWYAVVDHAGLTFNPTADLNGDTVNESWDYTGLCGFGLIVVQVLPETNHLQGGSSCFSPYSDSGEAVIARFTCESGGIKTLHLVTSAEATTFSTTAGAGGVTLPTDLQDATITCTSQPVGGVAEMPGSRSAPLETPDSSRPGVAGVAAIAAASVLALGGAAWYARRRWVR